MASAGLENTDKDCRVLVVLVGSLTVSHSHALADPGSGAERGDRGATGGGSNEAAGADAGGCCCSSCGAPIEGFTVTRRGYVSDGDLSDEKGSKGSCCDIVAGGPGDTEVLAVLRKVIETEKGGRVQGTGSVVEDSG